MSYTVNIIKVQITDDDTNDIAATVEVFDEGAASVKLDCLTNFTDWTALAVAVNEAIDACKLQGETP